MKYRRKPQVVEAMRFDGSDLNMDMICNFLGTDTLHVNYADPFCPVLEINKARKLLVPKGYYIAKTELGEILVIQPCDFERDYERIDGQ